MNTSEQMEKTGWKWEGTTKKGQDMQIIEDIAPWEVIACTESDQSSDYCDIWVRS